MRSDDIRRVAICLGAVTVLAAPIAYVSMFNGFRPYDDEGFFLLTLRDYLGGRPLASPYVPLYGPFYYEVVGGVFRMLGIQPTHDAGRWLTIGIWLLASMVGGFVAWIISRSVWLALSGEVAVFIVLVALSYEPTSTYGLSSLLVLCLVAAAAQRSRRPRASAAAIGCVVAALCLIKINVGALAAAAVAVTWAATLPDRLRRLILPAAVVSLTVLPLLLMASLFSERWVVEFAFLVALSAGAVSTTVLRARKVDLPPASTEWLAAGAAAVGLLCIGVALAGGTPLQDVWNTLVVFAIRFPTVFTFPMQINWLADVVAAISFAAAVFFTARHGQAKIPPAVRLMAGVFTLVSIILLPGSIFVLSIPLAWVALVPLSVTAADHVDPYARLLIPVLAVLETVQAYPVAGTQLAMAALAMMPVGVVLINDGASELFATARWPQVATSVGPAVLLANVIVLELVGFLAVDGYSRDVLLALPGAQAVRVPSRQADDLRGLVAAIDRNGCTGFLGYPAMDSLYLWSDKAPPTPLRYGQWWLTTAAAAQQTMVDELTDERGLCVVKNQKLLDFWTRKRAIPSQPLVDFIEQDFSVAGTYGDYQLLVRNQSAQ